MDSIDENAELCVLVVDDDAAICSSMRRVLKLDGYTVATASCASEMLSRSDLASFFAILLDRRLPDGDASGAVERLRQSAPDAAVLIVTGHADLDSTLAAIRQGVDDYLIKPVEPGALRARLKSLAELYRVKSSLKQSDARMRFLVENLPAGAIYVDDGKLVMNRAVEEMTGFDGQEISTVARWFEVLCGDKAEECLSKYELVKAEGFSQSCLLPIKRRDGIRRMLEIAGYRYDNREVWLVTDATELKDAQQRLVQAERLAAIGQMVTGLAHESRNALQRARGCLDLLELDLESQPSQLDLVSRIRRSLGDLQRNYEEVRNYAAPIALEFEPVLICDLVRDVFDDLKYQYSDEGHFLDVQCGSNCDELILIDKHRMRQVLQNVLENAIVASPAGTPIAVHTRLEEYQGSEFQVLEISDQGPGLTTETKARIFEPFYTTKQSGTGLGMAICQRIIEAHSGTIEAQCKNCQGVNLTDGDTAKKPVGCTSGTTIRIRVPYRRASKSQQAISGCQTKQE